jgi:hypothetical protein
MKKSEVLILISILALTMIFSALPVHASTPTEVNGQWRTASPPVGGLVTLNVKTAGANAFLTLHTYANYFVGDILGTPSPNIEQTICITFHYSDPEYVKTLPTGTVTNTQLQQWHPTEWNWKVERTFTGTVLGVAGGFTMKLEANGFGRIGAPEVLEGTWVIISGTGGLENLHGQGTWHSLGVQLNEYSGQVHFDP